MTTIDEIADKVRAGVRLAPDEALTLYREASTPFMGGLAATLRVR